MKQRKIQLLVSWLLCILCVLGILMAKFSNWFAIQHVTCSLNNAECPDFVQAEVQKMQGISIFGEWRKIPERIPILLPSYQLTKTDIFWPNSLVVQYQTLPVSYGVQFQDAPVLFIDQLGVVTEAPAESEKAQLKIAQVAESIYGPLQLRTSLPKNLHTALSLLFHHQQLESQKLQISVVSLNEIRVGVASGRVYIVAADQIGKDISQLLYLEKALDQQNLPAAAANPKEIDLRFKYPVLRTNTE